MKSVPGKNQGSGKKTAIFHLHFSGCKVQYYTPIFRKAEVIFMKVLSKQSNSRMCVICGLDNPSGVKAPFYNMEDGSVMSLFQFAPHHQSYPGRVHGGMITAMLDEMGLRAMWAAHGNEEDFGVTLGLTASFRKPVPYGEDLIAKGVLLRERSKFAVIRSQIFSLDGTLLAEGEMKYLKLDPQVIAAGAVVHEEMPYRIQDGVTDIEFQPPKG